MTTYRPAQWCARCRYPYGAHLDACTECGCPAWLNRLEALVRRWKWRETQEETLTRQRMAEGAY